MDSKKIKSFEEWKKAGYRIYKGSKAVGHRKSDGKPVFTEDQVWFPSYGSDYEDDYEQASYYGISPWGNNS